NDLTINIAKLRKDPDLTATGHKALSILEEREMLLDVAADVKEILDANLNHKLDKLRDNRSALACRVILLAELLGYQQHFGCRSGKDRTGLVDVEIKLLLSLKELSGRFLSYREIEDLPDIDQLRTQMLLESGNIDLNPTANLGVNLGMNTSGAAP